MSFNIVDKADDRIEIRHVLVSLFDKSGLDVLVNGLLDACPDVRFYSTGGTYKVIQRILSATAKERLISVSDYTGQPEMQGGLVKTLDFKIYLGLLSETHNGDHQKDLARTDAVAFDMVVANLYPFRDVVSSGDASPELARTNIDIGGPCMIRASAKNYIRVASVTNIKDYSLLVDEVRLHRGTLGLTTRFRLMQQAFAHTAAYDAAIAGYFARMAPVAVSEAYASSVNE